MPLFDPFTDSIITNHHQGDSFAVLHRNGSCVAFDQIIHYDEKNGLLGCVPCNVLVESESESDYLKDELLWSQGGIIQIPNLIVGGGSMGGLAGQQGLTFNLGYSESQGQGFDVTFEHEELGNTNALIQQQQASDIQLGFNSTPVVDGQGAVWGLNINIINSTLELPGWDLFLDVDHYLENSYSTCEDTQYGLSTSKHCSVCEHRARRKRRKEARDLEECLSETCTNGSTYSAQLQLGYAGYSYEECQDVYAGEENPIDYCWDNSDYDYICENESIDVDDHCDCICSEVGTITTWTPYKNFTPIDGWPSNWNQATITRKGCIQKAGDPSRYYCQYELETLMFGLQTFSSTNPDIAQGQTQQAGLQVQGSGGTLELNADGYSEGTHFGLRILGVNIASVGGDGSIDSSDGAFDGDISVSVDETNGTLIVNWSGASDNAWIFVIDYEFATTGQGDLGLEDNTAAAPSAQSVAEWLQTGMEGATPCDWKQTKPTSECCVPNDYGGGYRWDYNKYADCQRYDSWVEDGSLHRWDCGDTNGSCYDRTANIKNKDGTYGCKSTGTSHCHTQYDIEEAYDKCYEDCGSQTNIHGTNCYNGHQGENRPDIATDICHCGGGYKGEDTSCGWRAIMNSIAYSMGPI
jgi:hypothetical protein